MGFRWKLKALAWVLAALILPISGLRAQNKELSYNGKLSISTEAAGSDSLAPSLSAASPLDNGSLSIDGSYAGALPYRGQLGEGRHYLEFSLPGYPSLGTWITAKPGFQTVIVFDPRAELSLFAPSNRVSVAASPTLTAGLASLQILSTEGSGQLYIDRNLVGTVTATEFLNTQVDPGSHYLELDSPGYYPLGLWLVFDEKTNSIIRFSPEARTGYLLVTLDPKEARLSLDQAPAQLGPQKLSVGRHRISASCFGYIDEELQVLVEEGKTEKVSLTLKKAGFSVQDFSFSREAFNPGNVVAGGSVSLRFKASSYGKARISILGPSGSEVASFDFPDIQSAYQSVSWSGRDQKGGILPDGLYSAKLTAWPAEDAGAAGSPAGEGEVTANASVILDSSLVVRPRGSALASSGLLFMPDPNALAPGSSNTELFWFSSVSSLSDSSFGVAASLAAGSIATISLHASADLSASAASGFSSGELAGSALLPLFGDKTTAYSGAVYVRGSYTGSSASNLPGASTGIEASLPLGAAIVDLPAGETTSFDLRMALSPGAFYNLDAGNRSLCELNRAGIWLEGPSFSTGFSALLPLSYSQSGLAPDWPLDIALEGRLSPEQSAFDLAVYATAALSPSGVKSLGFGLGLGLVF